MATKYQTVADSIHEKIRGDALSPGDPLPSEHKLADQYGVSRITVRRSIEALEEMGLVERKHGRGTFVRRDTASGDLLYVGPTEDHFYRDLHAALQRQAQQHSRNMQSFSPEHHDEPLAGSQHLQEQVTDADTIICSGKCWPDLKQFITIDHTVVLVSGWLGDGIDNEIERPVHVVSADSYNAGRIVTEHLLELGHEEIGYFGPGQKPRAGEELLWSVRTTSRPYRGYYHAMDDRHLEIPPGIGFPEPHSEDWQEASERAIRRYVDLHGWPGAFVCEGDFRASPLLRVAMEMGVKVPQDVSVVGLCNTPWSEMLAPQLTTVDLQQDRMANLATLLADEPPPEESTVYSIEPRLVVRGSTAKRATQMKTCAV